MSGAVLRMIRVAGSGAEVTSVKEMLLNVAAGSRVIELAAKKQSVHPSSIPNDSECVPSEPTVSLVLVRAIPAAVREPLVGSCNIVR